MSQSNLLDLLRKGSPQTFKDDSRDVDKLSKKKNKEESKKNYKSKRVRKFQPSWKNKFDWVCFDGETNKMHCSTCQKYPELADKTLTQ